MKNLKTLMLLPGLICVQQAFAQTGAHLKLAAAYPAAGEKVSFTYDPTGTPVDGKKDIAGVVYFLDNKVNPATDLTLKEDGKLLKGEFTIPENTKAFFVRISGEGQIDNNNDKGYIYLTYKGQQPVAGAYAMRGYILTSGLGTSYGKIKMDMPEGLESYKKDFAAYPETQKDYEGTYYMLLGRNLDNKAIITDKIAKLEASNDEKDVTLASTLLRVIKDTKGADSLTAVIKTKFPDGTLAKTALTTAIAKEADPAKKEALYNAYIAKYPESTSEKTPVYDNLRVQLAGAYLQKGDMENYYKYAGQVKEKYNLAMTLNNAAYEWAKKGEHLEDADKLSKQSLDLVKEKIANPQPAAYAAPSQVKRNAQYSYNMYADTYAYILAKENKLDEALKYQQEVMDSGPADAEVNEHYIVLLNATGKFDKAKDAGEKAVISGQSNDAIKDALKTAYAKVKGSDAGFDTYLAGMVETSKNKAKAELAKTMINTPAPAFALKDLDGKTVSLADLKGKTVIVDFWATWCGPCKASFPGMQIALNKYKDDPNVKFLFVDTWETIDDFVPGVKKFIADNKYSFHVLLDEKGSDGRQSKVVSAFEVSGIPTKFIIDKTGNIRFKYIGYSGSTDKVVEEVVNMVDLTSNADVAAVKAPATKTEEKSKGKD